MIQALLLALSLTLAQQGAPPCQAVVTARPTPNLLGQHLLTFHYPAHCTRPLLYVRIHTASGGVLPPVGYFTLSAGWPRKFGYWVWPGVHVDQLMEGQWNSIPIQNLPPGWFK